MSRRHWPASLLCCCRGASPLRKPGRCLPPPPLRAAELRQPLCLVLLRNCASPYEPAVTAAVRLFEAILSAQVRRPGRAGLPQPPPAVAQAGKGSGSCAVGQRAPVRHCRCNAVPSRSMGTMVMSCTLRAPAAHHACPTVSSSVSHMLFAEAAGGAEGGAGGALPAPAAQADRGTGGGRRAQRCHGGGRPAARLQPTAGEGGWLGCQSVERSTRIMAPPLAWRCIPGASSCTERRAKSPTGLSEATCMPARTPCPTRAPYLNLPLHLLRTALALIRLRRADGREP